MAALVAGQIPGAAASGITGSLPARPVAADTPPWPLAAGHERVVIRRTEYGIPHILATSYRGLGYGYGYAFAQDNLCTMAEHVVTLRGERSAYFGPDRDSGDIEAPPSTNLASDIYYRTVLSTAVLRRLLALPPPLGPTSQVRALVTGYAAGYDRYLHDTGAAHIPDPTCRSAPWVGPITALDIWRNAYDVARMVGTDQFKQVIATASPPAASPGSRLSPRRSSLARTMAAVRTSPLVRAAIGSNAVALGRAATLGRAGMLLANPHLPWTGPLRLYQVQLTIPGALNVAGASLYGTPLIEVGHTEDLVFTGTVSTARRFTLYQLTLEPGHPTTYLVNGHPERMSRQTVTVTVRSAGGHPARVRRTVYSTRYGPVISSGWTTTTAFAIKDANAGNMRVLNEYLAMDRASSLSQLRAAQQAYQGIPWSNTIAADAGGTAYFADASVVPHVTDADAARCITTPQGRAAYPDPFILDGATSACAWGTDPGAIEPGIFGPASYPWLARPDYVTNSNDSPWLASAAAPITGYPRIFGDVGTQRSLRTRLGLTMITHRLSGNGRFSLPGLQQMMLNDDNYSAELARRQAVALCRKHPVLTASDGKRVNVARACAVLAAWDSRDDADSHGAVLWREFWRRAAQAPDLYKVPFSPRHPLTTPNTLDTGSGAVRRALADAVQQMRAGHLPLDDPLGAAQHVITPAGSIVIEGCDNDEGCFNITSLASEQLQRDGSYPPIVEGSSFIMAAELTATGPRTRTILTYSESANPDSPHHSDQTRLYSRQQWVTERFTPAQIGADPALRVLVLTV